MWRVVARQLMFCHQLSSDLGKTARLGSRGQGAWLNNCRSKSSVAVATIPVTEGSNGELVGVEVGWELRPASALPFGVSAALPRPVLNPIEGSVTALDEALHNAVQLPWLANPLWWMQFISDSKADGLEYFSSLKSVPRSALRDSVGAKSFGSSAAAVEIAAEEEGVGSNDVETHQEHPKEKTEKKQKSGQKVLSLRARQIEIESMAWQNAADEYRELLLEMCKKNLAPNLPYVQSLVLGWFEPLKKAIEDEQRAVENLEFKPHRAGYGAFITKLPADMLAVVTMHKLLGLLMTDLTQGGCVKFVSAASVIGEVVETEVGIYKLLQKKGNKKKKKKKNQETEEAAAVSQAETSGKLKSKLKTLLKKQHLRMASKLVQRANGGEPWDKDVRAKVGSILIQLFLDNAFLQTPASQSGDDHSELRPAFKHFMKSFKQEDGQIKQFGVIECDPVILQALNKSVRYMVMPYMPMLVKPLHWTRFSKGGHLVLPTNVMRIHGSRQQKEAIAQTSYSNLKKVFHALNTLGSIRWRINTRVLDVVEKIWADGGRIAEMVDAEDVPIPERPVTSDEVALKKWRFEVAKAKRINSERHSLRCDTELKLNVARKLRAEKAFYYPHNLDFRGRAYPLHPHLNHLGSDMCRGVLEFAVGRPLGPTGFRWLKIHLANLFAGGVDKLAFDGRVAFVDSNHEEIFDSAERPLTGRRWWLKAEDPFQCLATCMNIRDALMSGNTETFESYLPVHQDGSCNGLQHYAALGRDKIGAESVNLIAGEKPADVYTDIAMRVRAVIEKDAADDPHTNPNVDKAKFLVDQIDRKLVKQTVMTSVYGVTFIGARNQIMNRLTERGLGDEVCMFRAACYAAKVTIDALGQTFKEARCIMGWLGDCAKIIASQGEPVRWTTPMGLPVVQPYRKPGRKTVKTSLQVVALREEGNQPVAVGRQRSAFPPNFVHSLDGSHMMMTALACKRANLYFAGVHDSFWTHAGTIENLNSILRTTFVELYSDPILENLLKGFKKEFPRLDFPDVPRRGELELSEINCNFGHGRGNPQPVCKWDVAGPLAWAFTVGAPNVIGYLELRCRKAFCSFRKCLKSSIIQEVGIPTLHTGVGGCRRYTIGRTPSKARRLF